VRIAQNEGAAGPIGFVWRPHDHPFPGHDRQKRKRDNRAGAELAKLFADDMIVVDRSTDDTVAKAEAMGAKVRHFGWIVISPRRAITRFRNARWTGSSGSTATT
jgi:hypothetical protein